ncbi:MAG: cell envelope-related transcriptional attenuator [Candidatus Peregrinibacteria bacterium GW2011_GWE2_39_6]|nr:MAG: cell envelope-related transcriptional attenuator [Candidatus Peregrinibacteria bacterium GW2011_GWF2_39_17]KKR25478.1 MAG: cell envelope-related transcriptional attenuator [Candidatus Peregrinibacteria bacterium GW2011_GWE2_39_6]HCW32048.1 hypothetical protein [Candidatus Peregrinibacteria bacterium]
MSENNFTADPQLEWQYAEKSIIQSKKENGHHEMRWGLLFTGIALLILGVGLSFCSKKVIHELQIKDFQVNSLISEIGQIREENQNLSEKLDKNEKIITLIEEALDANGNTLNLQKKVEQLNQELSSRNNTVAGLLSSGIEKVDPTLKIKIDETLDVLILGTHGKLTDTIMLLSINETQKSVSLISIPRDLAVDGRRINEYWYRYGIDAMRDKIQSITDLYPEQYVVFDMKSFETIIDTIGGVEVNVEKDLYDSLYPGVNFTYEPFYLSAGLHHLDGKTALKYARSRESTTDFDRAKRQQQIIEAVKDKILSGNLLSKMDDMVALYTEVTKSIQTDIDLLTLISFAQKYQNYTLKKGNVLSTSNFLYSTHGPTGAYLLLPKGGNYDAIKEYVSKVVGE